MRIHGSNEYSPKAEAKDAKASGTGNDTGKSAGLKSSGITPAADVSKSGEARAATAPAKLGGQAVVLSATASRVAEVSSKQEAARSERLAEVKKQLDAGSYEVDFDSLADSLLAEEVSAKP